MSRKNKTDNPFIKRLYDVEMKTRVVVSKKGQMLDVIDRETGEVQTKYFEALASVKKTERTNFVKIYPLAYSAFKELSRPATLMLWYFLSNLGYGDTVALNMTKAKKFTGYNSDKSIYNAITELKKAEIIDNHYRNGIYFINPMLFYRGQRMKLIEEV